MLSPNFWPLLLYPGSLSGHGCLPLHPRPASGTPGLVAGVALALHLPRGLGFPQRKMGALRLR